MRNTLTESLDYHDMVNQVTPIVTIDEYSAKMGDDDEIVTLSFIVRGEQASTDLVDWFERGYDWVLDAQVSDGEFSLGKYLVFVEMDRRNAVPKRIIELLEDLETLTDIPLSDYTIKIDGEEYPAELDKLTKAIITSPHEYRQIKEKDLNEMRELSGMEPVKIFTEQDADIKKFKAIAGL